MSSSVPTLYVSTMKGAACIKIDGRANIAASGSFKQALVELDKRGYERFILDLTQCVTMDSTFLGVLAGLALRLDEQEKKNPKDAGVSLINPNERVLELLDNLGVAEYFSVRFYDASPLKEGQPVDPLELSREEISRLCLTAHETLMKINPDNAPKFKDVANFLSESLKKEGEDGSG